MKSANRFGFDASNNQHVLAALLLLCVVTRLPFLGTFELVAYDGTYYINQAKTLVGGQAVGAFPWGYPVAIWLLWLPLRDGQVAAQLVSFLASVGSAYVLYLLAKSWARPTFALLGAVVLALNPLFIRYSLMTMSEALFIFWVLLGLLMFARRRPVAFGLVMGAAVITRPEAIVAVALLVPARLRRPRQVAATLAACLVVVSFNVVVTSLKYDRLVLVPKSEAFSISTDYWKARERFAEYEGRGEDIEGIRDEGGRAGLGAVYLERMPGAALQLLRNLWPAIPLLALLGFRRRECRYLLAALVFFFIYPLLTSHNAERFVLPYIPILVLAAMAGLEGLSSRPVRVLSVVLVVVTFVGLPIANRAALLVPDEPELLGAKRAGIAMRDRVFWNDKVADRKPYLAFYARAQYVEIPVAPYVDAMEVLDQEGVRLLALNRAATHRLRPALRPLLYSRAFINGEARYRQAYFDAGGDVVYERVRESDPLRWASIVRGKGHFGPAWSPDGKTIAFRRAESERSGAIRLVGADGGGDAIELARLEGPSGLLDWSPDGGRIVYASGPPGRRGLYVVDVATRAVESLTDAVANDESPSWAPGGRAVVFASDRAGDHELFTVDVETGALTQLTSGDGGRFPALSPSGDRIAWASRAGGVGIMNRATGARVRLTSPVKVRYAPAWSPDGRCLALAANDWGSLDIYLALADGSSALVLTKLYSREAMPAWSPDGRRMALVSDREGGLRVWIVDGIEPYIERLQDATRPAVLQPLE